jgi:Cys-tRNA synthase (O-phospho-L-seryl-tRNA:Cys-tRNA synthase)
MSGLTFLEGIGHADHCQVSVTHRPRTYRYIWHHILPQVCGGKTESPNLVSLDDSCHYTIHILMWNMANNVLLPPHVNRQQLDLAMRGYQEAIAAGTAGRIPKEA